MKMMMLNGSIKVAAIGLATALLSSLAPIAQGQVGNLVFTESSPTTLTETLNGNPIGDWLLFSTGYPSPGSDNWVDVAPGADVVGVVTSSYAALDFADPLNPGNYFDIWGPNDNYKVFSDAPPSFEHYGQFLGVGAGDYLPFSDTGAFVHGSDGPEAVNITVMGGSVPDSSFTVGLLVSACAALVIAKRHLSKVGALLLARNRT